ncbi:MAG TPA: cysteine--tRNA ligase [Solirubrobacteraceae bacterium]|nr:cysteine--tRNA ligase [Solirubrobacteraceae bacterium]
MRTIRFYDTHERQVRPFAPRDDGKVGIYACGPTVYSRVHVGNARPFVVFSLLKRFLEHEGYDVTFVANITDINDKIYDAARAAGRESADLAREMTDHYVADTERLGLGRPDHEPLASDYVGQIIDLISALVDSDHAYAAGGDVYFRVRTLPEYGALSRRDVDQMDQGEGVEGADLKEDPLDFALWKAHKEGEDTAWDSPWGRGRPGWHIECSAMAEALLGLELDIHGGGIDLVFPHHENEAAQTLAGRGRPLARTWMHNGMLEAAAGEKMAKSVGNIRGLHDVLDDVGGAALVLFFNTGHYRQPLAYSSEGLEAAASSARRIRDAARRVGDGASPAPEQHEAFWDALADDYNTPRALAALYEWIGEANRLDRPGGRDELREMLWVLGLESLLEVESAPPDAVALADQREAARRDRDYAEADRLREELREMGWEVRDGPQGPELVKAS